MQPRLKTLLVLMAATASAPLYGQSLVSISQSIEAGDYRGALRRLDQLKGAPGFREQFLKGTALAEEGRVDDAIGIFKQLIEEFPSRPEPYNNLAALYARQNRLDEAKKVLEKAIRTHDSYAAVYENLSAVYVEMARSSYVKALRLEENESAPTLRLLYGVPEGSDQTSDTPDEGSAPAEQAVAAAEVPVAAPADTPAAEEKPASPSESAVVEVPAAEGPVASVEAGPASPGSVAGPAEGSMPAPEPQELQVAAVAPNEPPPDAEPAALEASPEEGVIDALVAWADAWSSQRVEDYVGFYARDFDPGNGQTRDAWEEERRRRIGRPGRISVQLDDFNVRFPEPDRAVVRLLQKYQSDVYRDKTLKRLELVRRDGGWMIRSEKSLKIIR